MTNKTVQKPDTVIALNEKLDEVKLQLKATFIGIDNVIDEIISSISSWFLLPDIQEKPLVLNLWGMTGVGKTDLIRHLCKHLGFGDRHYEFDVGKTGAMRHEIDSSLADIFEYEDGFPVVLSFDEFQWARSVNELGLELDQPSLRSMWEIIDTGKLVVSRSFFSYSQVYDHFIKLRHLISAGVVARKGKVVSGLVKYRKAYDLDKDEKNMPFYPENDIDDLFELLRGKKQSIYEVMNDLESMNGPDTLTYISKALKHGTSLKKIDLSKALVFILGNLDEAYTMSDDFNSDIDPDQFHKQSLKIDLPIIKSALKKRFRNEQIARLGNNHIIYPAFSKTSFEEIIDLKIREYLDKLNDQFDLIISADPSLSAMIYEEGVFPTQGVRPVLSCIEQNIKAKMGLFLSRYLSQRKRAEHLILGSDGNVISALFYKNSEVIIELEEQINQKVKKLRKNNKDDIQALTAVHECGHAIISMVLLKVYPEEIFSQAMDSDKLGFLYANIKWLGMPKGQMVNRIAYYMGGLMAEEIVFGEDNATEGSYSDLQEATEFVADMVRREGLGRIKANIQTKAPITTNCLHDDDNNEEIKAWLSKGKTAAYNVLINHQDLLMSLSNYLCDERTIKKEGIKDMVKRVEPKLYDEIENYKGYYAYRDVIKRKVAGMGIQLDFIPDLSDVSLNKSK